MIKRELQNDKIGAQNDKRGSKNVVWESGTGKRCFKTAVNHDPGVYSRGLGAEKDITKKRNTFLLKVPDFFGILRRFQHSPTEKMFSGKILPGGGGAKNRKIAKKIFLEKSVN